MKLGKSNLEISPIAVGCMRINGLNKKDLSKHIEHCIESGLNFFDHADIYGGGECESKFAESFKDTSYSREDIILESKCGIVPGRMYDLSKEHIVSSVDSILKRLDTEYLDLLAIHRPDALVEPEEVAAAFSELKKNGKVKYFGVSNHKPAQIELLSRYVEEPIQVNQMQLSIPCSNMIANGMEVNMNTEGAASRDGDVLDYCRLNDITIQAWSPFQFGFFEGVFIGSDRYPELNNIMNQMAEKYNTTPTAIATAWILRHPANIQMIAGSTNSTRMDEIVAGSKIKITREEWYQLYLSAGHMLP